MYERLGFTVTPHATAPIAATIEPEESHADDHDRRLDSTSSRAGASPTSTSRSSPARSWRRWSRPAPTSTAWSPLFDEHWASAPSSPGPATADDGRAADAVIAAYNDVADRSSCWRRTSTPRSAPTASTSTAQALLSQLESDDGRPPTAARPPRRLGARALGRRRRCAGGQSARPPEHRGPLLRLAARAAHQMSEAEEGLYAELATTGSSAWGRLHADVTSQLTAEVAVPRRHRRTPADAGGARAGHRRRSAVAPGGLRRRDARPGRRSPCRAPRR